MLNHYDFELLLFERDRLTDLTARRAILLAEAGLQARAPWRAQLAGGLIALAAWIAPASGQQGEPRLAYQQRH